jgi:hypothetical protein
VKWIQYDHGPLNLFVPPVTDRPEGYEFERGVPLQVPDEVAGQGAYWRPADPGEDVTGFETRTRKGIIEVVDLGSGLLAQMDLWREAPAPSGEGD